MTNNTMLYLEKSYNTDSAGNKQSIKNRLIPISKINRIWENAKTFGISQQDGYSDLFVEKKFKNETIIDFYKRATLPLTQPNLTIDNEKGDTV